MIRPVKEQHQTVDAGRQDDFEQMRAIAAHHSLLVFDILGCSKLDQFKVTGVAQEDYHGKEEVPQPVRDLAVIESGLEPAEWSAFQFSEGTGCLECSGSGYRGRTAITELLDLSDHIREMIIDRRPTSEIKRAAREGGMLFLRDSGLRKVRSGVTTLREINKVTFIE